MKSLTNINTLPPATRIEDIDLPSYGPDEVLIKVVVSGSNPKDWKVPTFFKRDWNEGDDIAGIVEAVGSNVRHFRKGDGVGGFHEVNQPGGSYAEYAVAKEHVTFHLPESVSFEEAATFSLAYLTAVMGLHENLRMPSVIQPAREELPLLVYGASTSIGAYAVKLAKLANIHPIIGVAGAGSEFAKSIGCDIVVDHRNGDVVQGIKSALKGRKLMHAFDAVSEDTSTKHCFEVLSDGGAHAHFLPRNVEPPRGIQCGQTNVFCSQTGTPEQQDIATTFVRLLTKWLVEGRITAHPYDVVPGGLAGVQNALTRLYEGKVSSKKLVFRIADTPGL